VSSLICVTTRFRLKHPLLLLPMYLAYRRMRRDLERAPGLIRYAFLLQSPVACCTFSLWESEEDIVTFSNVPNHIRGVRAAGRWCREIWSAYWRLDTVSKHANRWQGPGGQGRWPSFVPHPEYPWQLVPSIGREEASQ
jgi:hypothetical protein